MAVEKFLTVALLEPVKLGDESARLGPHITLCPPFEAQAAVMSKYHERLKAVMDENSGITVYDARPVLFGPNEDQPALRLYLGPGGFFFHAAAYVGGQEVADPDPTYAALNWKPHVTLPTTGYTLPEMPFTIPEIQLFMKRQKLWRCIARYATGVCQCLEGPV